jgi:hypothetical protein
MSVAVRARPEVHKRGVKRKILRVQSTDCLGRDPEARYMGEASHIWTRSSVG